MRRVVLGLVLVLAIGLVAGCGGDEKGEAVTRQLNWFHEAEFAGYYMAQAQGFYREEGLDVTILEGGPGRPAREQVLSGQATFAVTSFGEQVDMMASGQPAVAVMAAFQIPPLVIFSLAASEIHEPANLIGRRVGVTTEYWERILDDTLAAAGVDPAAVERVPVKPDELRLLYDGGVDAWLGYAQDEPVKAQTAGYDVTSIFPADFGIGGYEGLLITHQTTVSHSPDLVKRFVKATYRGWRNALEHPDEAARTLYSWAPENGLEFQRKAVRAVAPLVDTPQVPVGWIDAARWQQLVGAGFDPEKPGFTMQFSPETP
jgi:ABC-type nitrate/sulfonate/bicarbonate transport system substrate-binding protein